MSYRNEADALDAEIGDAISQRDVPDFNGLALRIFAHQLRYNEPYARYCRSLGVTAEHLPVSWELIPPVPAAAFKEAALCTFDPSDASIIFETSGTTAGARGTHYFEDTGLYDSSLLASFEDRFVRGSGMIFRFLLLVPQFVWNLHSSLAYMLDRAAECFGDFQGGCFIEGGALRADAFVAAARQAAADGVPAILAGTAFAAVALLDALAQRGIARLPLPAGSKIMETGGFKGRTRVVDRAQFYADLSRVFAVPQSAIVAEYGMTELCSQYYDNAQDERRLKVAPAWLRSYAVDAAGKRLPPGTVGALVHVDLANRSSCVSVLTEDLGAVFEDGLLLIGREHGADLRGCSLDAEALVRVSQ